MSAPEIYWLTDEQWDTILLAVPRVAVRDRRVFEAILHVLSTAMPWHDLPEDFGITYRTAWNRYQKWQQEGLLDQVLQVFLSSCTPAEQRLWTLRLQEGARQRAIKHGTRKRPLLMSAES